MENSQKISNSPPSSLNFLSTQIQSRYEVQEQKDFGIARLRKFRNDQSDEQTRPTAQKAKNVKSVTKRKINKAPHKPPSPAITLLSAFVRNSLASKKPLDSKSILDYFRGEIGRADEFISMLENVTGLAPSQSLSQRLALFTGQEWLTILDTLRLKFPNLSAPKKRSLELIKKRLETIKDREHDITSQNSHPLQSLWSQASNQPNDNLTTEELKWLYDLDEEEVFYNTSEDINNELSQPPFCFTLSQVLNDSSQKMAQLSNQNIADELTIENSEPELEPLSEKDLAQIHTDLLLYGNEAGAESCLDKSHFYKPAIKNDTQYSNLTSVNEKDTQSHPNNYSQSMLDVPTSGGSTKLMLTTLAPCQKIEDLDSIDVVTSIAFGLTKETSKIIPDSKELQLRSSSVVEIDSESSREVDSSPIINQDEFFDTFQDHGSDRVPNSSPMGHISRVSPVSHMSNLSNVREKQDHDSPELSYPDLHSPKLANVDDNWCHEVVTVVGHIELKACLDTNVAVELASVEDTLGDAVPCSEEEGEITTVRVSRRNLHQQILVLQVPSSP